MRHSTSGRSALTRPISTFTYKGGRQSIGIKTALTYVPPPPTRPACRSSSEVGNPEQENGEGEAVFDRKPAASRTKLEMELRVEPSTSTSATEDEVELDQTQKSSSVTRDRRHRGPPKRRSRCRRDRANPKPQALALRLFLFPQPSIARATRTLSREWLGNASRSYKITIHPPHEESMKIHEYQAKELLAAAGAVVPRGIVAVQRRRGARRFRQDRRPGRAQGPGSRRRPRQGTLQGLRRRFRRRQVHHQTRDDAGKIAEVMFNFPLVTKQTGADGQKVSKCSCRRRPTSPAKSTSASFSTAPSACRS